MAIDKFPYIFKNCEIVGRKSLPPAGLRPLGGKLFNPWDEEISIPETRPIQKSYISPLFEVKKGLTRACHGIKDLKIGMNYPSRASSYSRDS